PFSYTKLMKKLILKLKYYHKKDIGNFLAERLILGIMSNKEIQNQSQYKIGYVPSHRFRHYFIK
ncbi:hypothetical protein KKH82_01420, partial [Patescibacteria group bacterium]|nr:hypothetical protein [Patescibacteria group bacterium]